MNKWTRRLELSRASAGPAERGTASLAHHYFAFLSYSHRDSADADWLHGELESFRVPAALEGRLTANGVIPKRLTPIFRDRHELAASHDLNAEIRIALSASRCLIVLCSPAAAKSKWTNAEIELFRKLHPDGCIIAAIVAGEPLADASGRRKSEQCFPPALLTKYDRLGRPTGKKAEPLAADLRGDKDSRRVGLLTIVAGILGVGLDDLVQRDHLRRQRRLGIIAAASLAGMTVASGLAVTAIQARDSAREQRRQAENLIGFMLGDLKDKLEPIGKLSVLDGVGSRVLDYYKNQDTSTLGDQALAQRSAALSLMGEVAVQRGDFDGADKFYSEAMAGTAEAIRRKPDDPQRLFDHAQNVFWIGQIAIYKGSLGDADRAFREYKRLADQMVSLDPNSIKWRMEVYNADANLGGLLSKERRFPEASAQWGQVFRMIGALTTADPSNRDYRQSLVESLAWYADAEKENGHLDNATTLRERNVALLRTMAAETGDVTYAEKLVPAERSLGALYADSDRMDLATQHMKASVDEADRLTSAEPENRHTLENGFKSKIALAELLLLNGSRDEATSLNEAGCAIVARLLSKDPQVPDWRAGLRDCWVMRARLAQSGGRKAAAVQSAQRAVVAAKTVKTADTADDAFFVADSYRLLGDAQRQAGDMAGAQAAWRSAFASLPSVAAETPSEMRQHQLVLERVGRSAQAQQIAQRLEASGYRRPEFRGE